MKRAERFVEIVNRQGLHARPARLLTILANRFESEVYIRKGAEEVNAKSIMGVMTLAAGPGATLKFTAIGPDAEKALDALEDLVKHKFDED